MSNSRPSIPWSQVIIFVLLVAGVPTALATFVPSFIPWTKHHLWQAIVLGLLWLIGCAIISIASKVWQGLQSRWVDRLVEWFDLRISWLFAHYRYRYCQFLLQLHHDFDVKGLSTQGIHTLDLEQVYVNLRLDFQIPHRASPNPIKLTQDAPEPSPAIAEQKQMVGLAILLVLLLALLAFVGLHSKSSDDQEDENASLWRYLTPDAQVNPHLVILGSPGTGKTTLLKHVTLSLAVGKRRNQRWRLPRKLPILLFLREHAERILANPDYTLPEAVVAHLTKHHQAVSVLWFDRQLAKGKCLVLLDGLDEVADPQARQQVVSWVERQMVAYASNRFLVTSRPFGYRSNPLRDVSVLEVREFKPPQIERFIHKWYLANERRSRAPRDLSVALHAREGAQDLLRRLRQNDALSALAVNPLLLTMIATVHRYRNSLPGRRVELYEEICEVFLGKRQQAKGIQIDLTPQQKQRVLQPLAYHLMQTNRRELPESEAITIIALPLRRVHSGLDEKTFLQHIEESSGLLLELEQGRYGFAHQTFQEYLAAIHMKEQHLEDQLLAQVVNSWWHETIRLYCARADATRIVQACLQGSPPALSALELATACKEEALEADPLVWEQLQSILEQSVEETKVEQGPETRDKVERRTFASHALLDLHIARLSQIDRSPNVDGSLLSNAEYHVFLDHSPFEFEPFLPTSWAGKTLFPSGAGLTPVAGLVPIAGEVLCDWLNQDKPGGGFFRLPRSGEISPTVAAGHSSTEQAGYWTVAQHGWVLEGMSEPVLASCTPSLIQDAFAADVALLTTERQKEIVQALKTHIQGITANYILSRVRARSYPVPQLLVQVMNTFLALSGSSNSPGKKQSLTERQSSFANLINRCQEQLSKAVQALDQQDERVLSQSLRIIAPSAKFFAAAFQNAPLSLRNQLVHPSHVNIPTPSRVLRLANVTSSAASDVEFDLTYRRAIALDDNHLRARAVAHALVKVLDIHQLQTAGQADEQHTMRLYTHAPQLFLLIAATVASAKTVASSTSQRVAWRPHLARQQPEPDSHQLVGWLIDLYIDGTVQRAQRQGVFPVVGGIRLVRERWSDSSSRR